MSVDLQYTFPGPVAEAFANDSSFVTGIMGPFGSGKSSAACWTLFRHALEQQPFNGVRESRWAIIRNTYPELKSTTIKTWMDWFPPEIAPMKWDAPISSRIRLDLPDGTKLDMEVLFFALDRPEDVGKLRGQELTGAWINEASEIPLEVLDVLTGRVRRFPPDRRGGPTRSRIIMDTNPPSDDHWYYNFAEKATPKDWAFFRQPGGLIVTTDTDGSVKYAPNPDAENIFHLNGGYEYYFQMLGGKTSDWIKVFVLARYGSTMSGKPVYPEWNEAKHLAQQELKPIQGLPLLLGWDFGLTPACVIGQISPSGKLIIYEEFVANGMGIRQFAREVVRPAMANKYSAFKFESFGDPAGSQRAQTDEKTCLQELLSAGIATESSDTNDFIPRREAVAYFLNGLASGEPAFLLSNTCDTLRRGFNGGYRYARMQIGGIEPRYRERPEKDKHSHPHDALQYLAMRARGNSTPVRAQIVQPVSMKAWT